MLLLMTVHIKLQKMLPSKDVKSQLHQFNRQLDYGIFGGSAQFEGGIGEEDTSNYVRAVVPMAYYSTTRRVTVAANMIGAFDGVKAEDRAAADAAMKLAGDIEFDSFRGQSDFSNAGVFDGNPLAVAKVPNMIGVDQQVRQSDAQQNTQDLCSQNMVRTKLLFFRLAERSRSPLSKIARFVLQ
jgi:hypothetical protein